MIIDRPDRLFQLWAYTVSMGSLLLRSTKSTQFATRIDVAFQNVQALHLVPLLQGLRIEPADVENVNRIVNETGLSEDDYDFFLIHSGHFVGYIVASASTVSEDSGEFYDPSPIWAGGLSG